IQQRLFTQINQRIPNLEAGTMIVSEEVDTILPSSTFVSAFINWLYDQTTLGFPKATYFYEYIAHDQNHITIEDLNTTHDILHAYPFRSSPSQIVGVTFINNCLIVLDPQLDPVNPYLATNIQEVSAFSHPDLILPDRIEPPSELRFALDEDVNFWWCRQFLDADLAAQFGHWDTVVQIADSSLDAFPMDASMGRFFTVFIEGFTHTGRIREAVDLTVRTIAEYPETNEMMCRLWDRILNEGGGEFTGEFSPHQIRGLFSCE
ncbi:MAG TPA: hypothetical protein VN376_10670, partial [Longilinea sp.]|nr:hypothetical protein [Longilinea sp.]